MAPAARSNHAGARAEQVHRTTTFFALPQALREAEAEMLGSAVSPQIHLCARIVAAH